MPTPDDDMIDSGTPTLRQCADYLKDIQKDRQPFLAEQFYNDICEWLEVRRCLHLFDDQYLQRYAMQQARYAQVERLISKYGALSKNSADNACINPLESIALDRLKQLNAMSHFIINEVRQNSAQVYAGGDSNDPMAALLSGKG